MKIFNIVAAVVAIAALTVAGSVMHGRMTDRWGERPDSRKAGDAVASLPLAFGSWERVGEDAKLDENVQTLLRCYGSVNRTYQNVETGERVAIALLAGPSHTLVVHSPEVCYSGAGYTPKTMTQAKVNVPENDEIAEFRRLTLQSNDIVEQKLLVYYGWSAGDDWKAPEDPRWSLGHAPYLFKLQAAAVVADDSNEEDVVARFLADALPTLRTTLQAAQGDVR